MSESAGRPAPRYPRSDTDLAPIIAQHMAEMGALPCAPCEARRWTLARWPHADEEEIQRAYEIAIEVFEDDYLFDYFLSPFTIQ